MKVWIKVAAAVAIAVAAFVFGHHVAALAGGRELAQKQAAWDSERSELARQRADAITARMLAEHAKALALDKAAQSYEQGKTDAQAEAARDIADLTAGARRLRDEWATCRATSTAVSSAAAGAGEPDGAAGLLEDGIRRVLSAVGQCHAQRDALQQALIADRAETGP